MLDLFKILSMNYIIFRNNFNRTIGDIKTLNLNLDTEINFFSSP